MKNKSILVIFGKELPKKNKSWFQKFDKILYQKDVEALIDPGSVQEACRLIDNLSLLTLVDGSRLSKFIKYRGYELWWIHHNDIYNKFCLSYTQYRRLLSYLKDFKEIYFYQAPHPGLFRYFLNAYGCQCIIGDRPFQITVGILIQAILSLPFLLWLKISRPRLMVWTSDQFDSPRDYDFRMRYIYEELRKREIPFVEFIRSQENLSTVLKHAWQRKRPVFYSAAIISLLHYLSRFFKEKKTDDLINAYPSLKADPDGYFWFLVATHYFRYLRGTIWSIKVMEFVLRWIGIRSAIIPGASSRTFHEILACKLNGIKTVNIQHGLTPRSCNPHCFMNNFDGELVLTPDFYGLWSDWWRNYFLANSRAYRPDQLFVSGHMRPLELAPSEGARYRAPSEGKPIKVLFVFEQLADPLEVIPHFLALLEVKGFDLYIKLRPYRDGFEEWLKENRPEILGKVKILRGNMHEAIAQCDVTVGSYSTGVLEALLQLKPFVFFRTGKWGDYFELKSSDYRYHFFAENPNELIDYIRKSREIPREVLMELREKYFGDPYKNGSKWVVDQVVKLI